MIGPKVNEADDRVIELNASWSSAHRRRRSPPPTLSNNARNNDADNAQSTGPRSRGEMRAESKWTVNNSMIGEFHLTVSCVLMASLLLTSYSTALLISGCGRWTSSQHRDMSA